MEENNKDVKNETIEWIKSIVTAVVIAILIKAFIFNTTYVLGNSMYPTLHEKDRLFANKVSLYFKGPSRGDVIVLKAPDDPVKDYIKRVIGIEGDLVEIKDGKVYVNGSLLNEPYLVNDSYTHIYDEDTWKVPKGQVFVLGDNRAEGASKDSRYFGCVSVKSIKGITGFRYFPVDNRFGKIN
ncbi:signal peptidase I [Tissierella praeacuta DSM 18095]|uniref:Signal peptidase I n=1 Tax=Tissierella praeacuta DSM 18095 TaxID=1123404 RepID=A0A1M4S836_9FIRM|nr:signal peptidase I [Tissierella praeacuta]SHE28362.1 signal peptidase I [Tissierella praeacuta DSM 18095]SUP01088.1 Signal peptidase I S [Tissierella praeacuta]